MELNKLSVNETVVTINQRVEQAANRAFRTRDRWLGKLHLGGRKATYDDIHYEFLGGPSDVMRKKHYDKSLRLLWKAEQHAPWSSFKDLSKSERALLDMAEQALDDAEREEREKLSLASFREMLRREYTAKQRRALVSILSAIGHGEAYAWLVSAEVLASVESTGAKSALTMQVLEEAKHFVVLRELVQAFGEEIPPLSAWEYALLEGVYKAEGLEKLFGMNVVVEGIALSIFGMFAHFPGMEILRLFHLDESRHTALPQNYFKEFPMSRWQMHNPLKRLHRLRLVIPALPLLFFLENELAELGIDAFDFGGSVLRKILQLSERAGFLLPLPAETLAAHFNWIFNAYCRVTRPNHSFRNFVQSETTQDRGAQRVEAEIFN